MSTLKIPTSEDDLPFRIQRKMVDWMNPLQLAQTGLRAVLSTLFGAYADQREVQSALSHGAFRARLGPVAADGSTTVTPLPVPDGDFSSASGEFWLDFVADLGDGFDSTYTVARLLATETLTLTVDGQPKLTHRGQLLVMGGDQVYPTASREKYRDRFEGPYTAALPGVLDEEKAPTLFALPGNHDWYDGLTSFMRLFCQQRWIGGWRTQQRRSYFAIKLPHGWWLWGIDIQLTDDIDQPQIEYFERIAESDPYFAGSKVILCTGQPSWTQEVAKPKRGRLEATTGYANLGYFEKRVIVERGGLPVLTLTGDHHHYCRYFSQGDDASTRRQKITAGGGGAYLYGTHSMPQEIELDDSLKDTEPPVVYQRGPVTFPSRAESMKLAARAGLLFPWKGRGLAFLLGAIYLFNAWIVQSASKRYGQSLLGELITWAPQWSDLGVALHRAGVVLAHSPGSVALLLSLLVSFTLFAEKGARPAGLLHGATHLFANLVLAWRLALLNFHWLQPTGYVRDPATIAGVAEATIDRGLQTLLFSGEMLLLGSLVAGVIFGTYLTVCALLPPHYFHINEAFSSQAIVDFKNFLRLKIDAEGRLTLLAIGIRKVCRWEFQPPSTAVQPWFQAPEALPLKKLVELIEEPLTFDPPRPLAASLSAAASPL